jgi:transcriptional regulator with XRE-family HTH domain
VGNPRRKPERLPAKLLTIRQKMEVSQSQMAKLLELETGYPRISEYEIGKREPDLIILLRYAKLARVSMDVLADDARELKFRKNWKPPKRKGHSWRRLERN